MVAPNRQAVVNNQLIVVSLVNGRQEVSVAIGSHPSGGGGIHPPRRVSIEPFLKGGLTEAESLEKVLELVALGAQGIRTGNG